MLPRAREYERLDWSARLCPGGGPDPPVTQPQRWVRTQDEGELTQPHRQGNTPVRRQQLGQGGGGAAAAPGGRVSQASSAHQDQAVRAASTRRIAPLLGTARYLNEVFVRRRSSTASIGGLAPSEGWVMA